MRRGLRIVSRILVAAGVLLAAWVIVVWQWQDPFTALYTHFQQEKLGHQLSQEFAAFRPAAAARGLALDSERSEVAADAARFRRETHEGQAIGRIVIGRIGLNMVVVDGTTESSLEKGPGRDLSTYMPGQNRLVYIAGHRTTYLAPFSHINDIRVGDYIRLEMPYATFVYRATGHRIVLADDLSVLRSPKHEELELQACHPRFFATHRYIVYAKLVAMTPRA
ncbi:MAG: class E sortase [Actinobacteria bacterium]|nr:class E sortase [Actinomycetota bacterium]